MTVRHYDSEDARRDALVEAMQRHVRAARPNVNYEADIEYMEHAIVAFTDEQLRGAVEAVRAHYEGHVKANGDATGNMRPSDRELWIAVLGPKFGGR